MDDLPGHVVENRRYWDAEAPKWAEGGRQAWEHEPRWGIWQLPDHEVSLLPADLTGRRVIELGCGTGYVSAWAHRRGAVRQYAIDNSEAQLATARQLATEHGVTDIEWVHGNAETIDQPDESFDFAVSEYGAAIWCDPDVWIPEAHRLLRPGGELAFLGNHPLAIICSDVAGAQPVGSTLERTYFGLDAIDWTHAEEEPGGIEFNRTIAEWLALFRRVGFDVLDYRELQAPADAAGVQFWTPAEWAKRFPAEQVWWLRKR
ncbi:MAG: class I SAM-dependent methyltransferase [Actinomycetota bacterium]